MEQKQRALNVYWNQLNIQLKIKSLGFCSAAKGHKVGRTFIAHQTLSAWHAKTLMNIYASGNVHSYKHYVIDSLFSDIHRLTNTAVIWVSASFRQYVWIGYTQNNLKSKIPSCIDYSNYWSWKNPSKEVFCISTVHVTHKARLQRTYTEAMLYLSYTRCPKCINSSKNTQAYTVTDHVHRWLWAALLLDFFSRKIPHTNMKKNSSLIKNNWRDLI